MAVVETEVRDRIMFITLRRGEKRNALTTEMDEAIRAAFDRFGADTDAWVAVLAAEGPDFCAGVDLHEVNRQRARRHGGVTRGFECWKPIVAALQGNVLGGGLELALCADLRIADETTRLGSPEVRWGLMQGAGATQRLPRTIPFAVALEMLFTGEPIDSARAERMGLVNRVVPVGTAVHHATAVAEIIASRAPLAVRRAKEAAYRGWDMALPDGLRVEQLLSRTLAGSEDLVEGQRAFVERRAPVWHAR